MKQPIKFPRFQIIHLVIATMIAAVLVRIYVFSPYILIAAFVVFGLNGLWLPILIAGLSFFGNKQQSDPQSGTNKTETIHFHNQQIIRWLVQAWILSVLILILLFLCVMIV